LESSAPLVTCPFCQNAQPVLAYQPMRRAVWLAEAGWLYRCRICRQFIALKVAIEALIVDQPNHAVVGLLQTA
jgi:hypothetical protein